MTPKSVTTNEKAYKNFFWQDGYNAFSVYPVKIERVRAYFLCP